ncbi:hypothetical protein HJ202_23970 [Vibrio parahaemolyticus]|nr:hypothetical protein [Vibrio parahaemolyticus]
MIHIQNENVQKLMPYLKEYVGSKLSIYEGNDDVDITSYSFYAQAIVFKVTLIDNTFSAIEIGNEYIKNILHTDQEEANYKYAYHVENVLLRMSKIQDLCFQLVGSVFAISEKELTSIKCKSLVRKQLKKANKYPEINNCLTKVENEINNWSGIRNEIAHNENYTSENYNLWSGLALLKEKFPEAIGASHDKDIKYFKELEIKSNYNKLVKSIENLHELIESLINECGLLFCNVLENIINNVKVEKET